jgi:hypothetical protein
MKPIIITLLFLAIASIGRAQETLPGSSVSPDTTIRKTLVVVPEKRWGDIGAGFGLDYGGLLGVKGTFNPIPYLGVFVAGGLQIGGYGWNTGIIGRVLPALSTRSVRPYAKVMYGVNAATKVDGKPEYDGLYTGLTAGIGSEFRFGRKRLVGLNLDLNVPFRSPEFYETYNNMLDDPSVELANKVLPIAISVGFHVDF